MKPRPTRWVYGPGRICMTGYGTYAASVGIGHSKRRRRSFKTLAEAKAWIMAGRPTTKPLDQLMLEDAMRARETLPDTVTLEEAARFWASAHEGVALTPLGEAVDRYRRDVEPLLRARTFRTYGYALRDLLAHLGADRVVSDLRPDDIEGAIAGKTPHGRNGCIRAYSAFFNWCKARGISSSNPAGALKRARIPRAVPGVLTPDEGRRLLSVASGKWPDTVAYFALGMFAGLRPEEAMRVRPSVVRNGYIVLDGSITKTADARNVPMRENLVAWLAAYPIPDRGFSEKRVKAVRRAFGRAPQDVARHSYATYLYELTADAARCAASMGHVGTEVFFKHYRALAAPGSGSEWFNIKPPSG